MKEINPQPLNNLERIAVGVACGLGALGILGEIIAHYTTNANLMNNSADTVLMGALFGGIASINYDLRGGLYK